MKEQMKTSKQAAPSDAVRDYPPLPAREDRPALNAIPYRVYTEAQMHAYVDADRKERQLAACNFCLSQAAIPAAPSEVTDAQIIEWAIEEQFLLFCDEEDVVQIVRSAFQKWPTLAALTQPTTVQQAETGDEVTDAMVDAYLKANDAYWKQTDQLPSPPDKWRTGTPREATRVSLAAALSQTMQPQAEPAAGEQAGAVAVRAWINYPVKVVNGEFAGYGEPELSFKRLSYGYDCDKAEALYLAAPGAAIAAREEAKKE